MQTETETTRTERTLADVMSIIAAMAQAQEIGRRFGLSCADGIHWLTPAELDAVAEAYGAEVKNFAAAEGRGPFRVAYVELGRIIVHCYSRAGQ